MYERLAIALAEGGISCFRYDRRGVGDSDGEDPGFRSSRADLEAAATAFRGECPSIERLYGFGLCDGATALALFGSSVGLDGLILVNPWLVEAASGEPPPAAIRRHYRDRLLSFEGWRKLLSGGVDYRKLLRGALKVARPRGEASLAAEVADALRQSPIRSEIILATGDATAIAAGAEIKASQFRNLVGNVATLNSDSHLCATGDEAADGAVMKLAQLDS